MLSRLTAYDVTWDYVNAAIWSAAEPSMGVIAACVPSLRPLLALVCKGSYRGPAVVSSGAQATNSGKSSRTVWSIREKHDVASVGAFKRLENPLSNGDRDRWGHETNFHGSNRRETTVYDQIGLAEMRAGNGGIKVKSEIIITSHVWDYKDRLY